MKEFQCLFDDSNGTPFSLAKYSFEFSFDGNGNKKGLEIAVQCTKRQIQHRPTPATPSWPLATMSTIPYLPLHSPIVVPDFQDDEKITRAAAAGKVDDNKVLILCLLARLRYLFNNSDISNMTLDLTLACLV